VTNVPIDKTNLTNFQRIFSNEKDLTQTANGNGHRDPQPSSVFEVVHSIASGDTANIGLINQQDIINGNISSQHQQQSLVSTAIVCNPLLLTLPSYDQPIVNGSCNGNFHSSSNSISLNDGGFNSNMHINRMFGDTHDLVNIFFNDS
jgi:hypothetical protein